MPKPIALQLYTLREEAKSDFRKVIKFVADTGYPGVELAGTYGLKPAEFKKVLDDHGLQACGAHGKIFDPTQTEQIVEEARIFGYTCVGGGFGPSEFETEEKIRACAKQCNEAAERLAQHGLKIYYHNHWWEWNAANKGALLFKLCPKLFAQFDIYWIQTGGADPAQTIRQFADRVLFLHVKDGPCTTEKGPGTGMTAVGKGKVDVKAALAAAEKTPCEWYIVELDRCDTDMYAAVKESYTYLVGNKLATGKK